MTLEKIKDESIGVYIADKIVDLAKSLNKTPILDELSIYGTSSKDGSAVLAFEWFGDSNKNAKPAEEVYDFLKTIRRMIIGLKKEVVEQQFPEKCVLQSTMRIVYRFRIWDVDGTYEFFNREPVVN